MLFLIWAAAAAAWADAAYLLVTTNVGAVPGIGNPLRVLYYVLAVVGPALTFFPLGRLMALRSFGFEATLSWAGLLVLVTFVSPETAGLFGYLAFLALLFGATASVLLPLGYALGFKLLTLRAHRRDTGRARREAYLGALFVVLSLAMNMGGFYNLLNALLLLGILALVESFALGRKPGADSL
ncbi:MAG: hypothetical protein M3P51_18970 [Chloroflexota bacterium]|nr:hypothetical protein [Chloroflexota bacterium]